MGSLKKTQIDYVAGVDAPRNYQREGNFDHGTKGFAVYREEDAVTFTIATDEVGLVGHGLAVDDKISFISISGGTTGISVDTDYFVKTIVSADAVTIAASIGGATIDLATSDGTGVMVRAKPKLGTGGSPSITLVRSTSTPLKGDASGLLTKGASNLMGEGISYDFTIDRKDLAKNLYQRFVYEVASGTFATGDIKGFIYGPIDGTPVVTALNPEDVLSSANPEKFESAFLTASVGSQYRLCLHVSSVSVLAYSLKLDEFKFQQIAAASANITEAFSATTNDSGYTFTSGVDTIADFDTVLFDTLSGWDSINKKYVIQSSGTNYFKIDGNICLGPSGSGYASITVLLRVNGTFVRAIQTGETANTTGLFDPNAPFSFLEELSSGDEIEIWVNSFPGVGYDGNTPDRTNLNIYKI